MWEDQFSGQHQGAGSQDTADLFDDLIKQSLAVVYSSLNQPDISPQDKLSLALKILEIARSFPCLNANQLADKISEKIFSDLEPSNSNCSETSTDESSSEAIQLIPNFVQIDHLFSEEDYYQILDFTLKSKNNFIGSDVVNEAENYRKSYVLLPRYFSELQEFLTTKILTIRPSVLQKLNIPMFLVSNLEMQITAHLDGGFYKIHQDVDQGKIANRTLSYVYYFYREPKPFYGGELRLYQTTLQGNKALIQDQFIQVEPRNNSIVFFDSRLKHEVLPVYCPSQQFEDSRFTLNGWIHR